MRRALTPGRLRDLSRIVAHFLPKPLPVVAYLHGSGLNNADFYDNILTDMAEAGFVVVFPKYSGDLTAPNRWYDDAVRKSFSALGEINSGAIGYVEASVQQLALAGHSAGGMYSLKLAAHPWLPAPKLVVLHDAGGFGAFFRQATPAPFDPAWLDNIRLASDTRLAMLIGAETFAWQVAEGGDGDGVNMGNAIMSGVWTRAWWFTGLPSQLKHALLMPGGHNEVLGGPLYPPYRDATINALEATFRPGVQFNNQPLNATDVRFFMSWIRPTPWSATSDQDERDWVVRLFGDLLGWLSRR